MSQDMSDPGAYGDAIADMYDELCSKSDWLRPEDIVGFLADLAAGGRALELGIGTGRVAIPLQARGIDVAGIDASEHMIRQLRQKPGADAIRVVVGDFSSLDVEGSFKLVYVVFNTLFHLTSQEQQIACFANVARCLEPTGTFVVEAFVPSLPSTGKTGGQMTVWNVTEDTVDIGVRWYDVTTQSYVEQHMYFDGAKVRLNRNRGREAWPSELDLMARLAGLRLSERWGGWRRQPFNSECRSHVSVYQRSDSVDGASDREGRAMLPRPLNDRADLVTRALG